MKKDAAKKLMDESLAKLQEELESGSNETIDKVLAVMSKFHNYSFGNVMMIAAQRPEATRVAGFKTWQKLGRQVRKGEKGIAIFAPMTFRKKDEDGEPTDETITSFRVVHVFDVSQTDGEPLPEVNLRDMAGDPGEMVEVIEAAIKDEFGVELEYEELANGVLGASTKGKIAITPGLSAAERFAVLAHEVAHELLHQRDEQAREETTHAQRETEAEAVAAVCCRSAGIETEERSADYIRLQRGDAKDLKNSLERIRKTADEILRAMAEVSEAAEKTAA